MTLAAPQDLTMQAVVQDSYGSAPESVLRVERIARPEAEAGEVLVRVHAASVDRGTWHLMAGLPYPVRLAGFGARRPKFHNPGRAFAGTIVATGEQVYGIADGSFAEYVSVKQDKLAPMPAGLTFEQAAAVPISGLTALQAVRDHAQVRAGQSVLVIGASGGVGSFAVQVAKAFGAEVTGVASTAKLDAVRALGADHVIDYTSEELTGTYDVILDIAGNRPLAALRRLLSAHGRLLIVGGETGGRLLGGTDRQIRATLLSPFVGHKLGTFIASENAADLDTMRELIESGKVVAAVDRAYPLAEAAASIRHLLDGSAFGKIVLSV